MKNFFLSIFILTFSANLFAQYKNSVQLSDAELEVLLEERQRVADAAESLLSNLNSSTNSVSQANNDDLWQEKTGSANPFNGQDVGNYAKPAIVDIDNDGDYDVFVGSSSGQMYYYKNTGSNSNVVLTKQTSTSAYPLHNVNIGGESNPTFVDIDGDGDFDLFNGITGGTVRYYQNTGSKTSMSFTERTSSSTHPLYGKDFGTLVAPVFVDIDNDGDFDFFTGHSGGTIIHYLNTGTKTAPAFTEKTGASNPFNNVDVGNYSQPTFVDLDNDGDKDALIGASDGKLYFYKNTGTASASKFTAQTGNNNPFNAIDVGIEAAPEFADMDGDGDVDLFVGESSGGIKYFIQNLSDNTPPAKPTVVTSTPGNGSVFITWKQNTEVDLKLYKIYGGTSSGSKTVVGTSVKGTSSIKIDGLTNGTTYYGYMTAVDTAGNESAASDERSFMPHNVDSTLSMSFDGSNDYVKVLHNDSLSFGTGDFAFSAWFRLDKVSGTQQILSKRASGSGNFEIQINTDKLTTYVGASYATGSTTLAKDTWYHVLATRSSGAVKVYLNGSQESAFSSSSTATSSGGLYFGSDGGSAEFLDGLIEDVSIWNVGLSANAAATVYNAGTPIDLRSNTGNYTVSANLKGYWRFSEGSGTLAHDFSGKGLHGSVSGAGWSTTVPTGTKVSTIAGIKAEAAYRGVKLDWKAATNAEKYFIYQSTDNSNFSKLTGNGQQPTTDSLDISGLTPGTKYYYKVSGVNDDDEEGPTSPVVSVTPNRLWWVDDVNGNDNYNGKTKKAAFQKVHKILENNDSLLDGDTVMVMPSVVNGSPNGYYDFGGNRIDIVHSRNFVMIGVAGADSTIFDAEEANRHFYMDDGQTSNTVIKGITFKSGKASGNNVYPGGGSLYIGANTDVGFVDCVWDTNSVDNYYGGAITIEQSSDASFVGCTFKNNYAEHESSTVYGGAIWIRYPSSKAQMNSPIVFKQTKFINNYIKAKHGAYGGAVYSDRSTEFINCLFVKNYVIAGNGANANDGHEGVAGALFAEPAWYNGSSYDGGTTKIINSTFHGNYADVKTNNGNAWAGTIAYGRYKDASSQTYLFNTIVSGSRVLRGGSDFNNNNAEDRIIGSSNNSPSLNTYSSNFVGSTGTNWFKTADETYDIVPVYTDTTKEDYRLSDKSPLIGKGFNTWDDESIDAPTIDLIGLARPSPSGSSVDMGAYENSLAGSSSPLPVSGFVAARYTNGAKLSWTKNKKSLGSSDDAENVQYQIYSDGSLKGTTTGVAYTITGLTNGTAYKISVAALDTTTKLEGAQSVAVSVTPRYLGPWYVAAGSGAAASDTSDNYEVGSSSTPMSHLKGAIEIAASGDTIILKEGTHSGSSDRGRDWNNSKSLVIMGDPSLTADKIIIDAKGKDRHFTFDNQEDTTTQIIGLTLKNGYDSERAGSIYIGYASVILKGVIFQNNYSEGSSYDAGGAIFGNNTSAIIDSCIFDGNYINSGDEGGRRGGAISVSWQNNANEILTIKRSTFKNNYVQSKKDARGGAVASVYHAIRIENSVFHGNSVKASMGGSQAYNAFGGAIFIENPSYWNQYTSKYESLNAYLINNTIVNNNLKSGVSGTYLTGTALYIQAYNPSNIYLFNNIVWNNQRETDQSQGTSDRYIDQIYYNVGDDVNVYADYNNIQKFDDYYNYKDFGDFTLNSDPAFKDSTNKDFTLTDASLMLGGGVATYEGVAAPSVDFKGLTRPNPSGSNPDLGAYENSLAKSPYPKPVKNLTAKGGASKVTLTWNANETADKVKSYKVYKHTASFNVASTYFVDSTTDTSYTISNLDNATRYYFRVTAVNEDDLEGTASNSIDITPKYTGPIWWVAMDGGDDKEGSETDAFATLKKALESAASGDTITLKKGVYKGNNNRSISIQELINGSGTSSFKLTIQGETGIPADSIIVDAENQGHHFNIGGDLNVLIKNLTLYRGDFGSSNNTNGSSVSIQSNEAVEFNNVIFRENRTIVPENEGGWPAVYLGRGNVRFIQCQFIENSHTSDWAQVNGGAVSVNDWNHSGEIIFDQCLFKNNLAETKNTNNNYGAAMGSAIYWGNGKGKITNSIFEFNRGKTAKDGVQGVIFVNSLSHNNTDGHLDIINNTFYGNSADAPGGYSTVFWMNLYEGGDVSFFNNIIWDNSADGVIQITGAENGNLNFGYNNVQSLDQIPDFDNFNTENNISLNPGFIDTEKSDFRLSDKSVLIGKGVTSFYTINAPKNDYRGNSRPSPSGSNPDLGAHENSLSVSPYPSQVTNLNFRPGSETIDLHWSANSEKDIDKYQVYMSTVKDFIPSALDSIGSTADTTFFVTGLTNKQEYFFRVAARDSSGYLGDYSDQLLAMPEYSGPIWWISNSGNDTNDGDEFSPLASLKEALNRADNGDTISVKPGIYHGDENAGFYDWEFIDQDSLSWTLTIRGATNNAEDVIFDGNYQGQGNGKQRFFAFKRRDQFEDKFTFENITFQNEYHNGESSNNNENSPFEHSGGGAFLLDSHAEFIFRNVVFKNNQAQQWDYHGGGGAIHVRLYNGRKPPVFIQSSFINNQIRSMTGNINGQESAGHADGGAVFFEPGVPQPEFYSGDVRNEDPVIFEQCYFEGNRATVSSANHSANGSALYSDLSVLIVNSVFANNRTEHPEINGNHATVVMNPQYVMNDQPGGRNAGRGILINNTFYGNNSYAEVRFQLAESGPGIFAVYNNIFDYNKPSGRPDAAPIKTNNSGGDNKVDLYRGANLFTNDGNHWIISDQHTDVKDDGEDVVGDPQFKGAVVNNFQLRPNSPAIDKGYNSWTSSVTKGYNNDNAPIIDNRGFYRVGKPDIGALEFGASKYLLSFEDDIDASDTPIFVKLNQQINFTLNTKDLDGNLVGSGDSIRWNIFPSAKYITIEKLDSTIFGGTAKATFRVSNLEKSKGFRFRVEAELPEGAFISSDLYVIEEIVTGSPPPVLALTIDPKTWTNQPDFKLSWETPNWDKQRELLGLVLETDDGFQSERQFFPFPTGDTLVTVTYKAADAGEFDLKVWLVDELGNESSDSARSVKAYFDNVPPSPIMVYSPNTYIPQDGSDINWFYSSDTPRFEWDDAGDYPSGIKKWILWTQKQGGAKKVYGEYTDKDVTFNDGNVILEDDVTLDDGYYTWWLEAEDNASNLSISDSAQFAVDISAPFIVHNNPLIEIDENSTPPAISAEFSDGASGVSFGQLHYRRANTGSFITVSLLDGPYNIPGSDIKANGLEYYIDTGDNVGNYGRWPEGKAFQSVRVRSEDPISTAGNLNLPGGKDSTSYIFFSIPFDVGNGISAFKAMMDPQNEGPDEFKYRLYSYSNGWQENPSSLTMGNAYFFIFDPDKYSDILPITFDFGQGVSTETDPPYMVSVGPGQWKFFGTPYNFNVSLSNIYTENGTSIQDAGSIYTWNGSWTGVGSSIQPWKGYIFKSGGDTQLHIDARGTEFSQMAKSMSPDNYPLNSDEWIIDMIASTGNARDQLNSVGVRHIAEDGYDRLDEFEPPVAPGDISLRIDNRDREISPDVYAIDIRKPNEEGHYWDLQVLSPTNGDRTYLTFEGLGYIPDEYDVFLINKTNKQAINLEWESTYRFANTGSKGYVKQDFRLVVGTKEFVEANNAGVNLYPDAFTLSQNYPNPFNPQTSIRISLEQDAQVDLIIYNLLGEEITRLAANEYRPAGYYNFIWNGQNAMGTKVSTGVYFYHAMIRNPQGKVVLNKTRKMIFLK